MPGPGPMSFSWLSVDACWSLDPSVGVHEALIVGKANTGLVPQHTSLAKITNMISQNAFQGLVREAYLELPEAYRDACSDLSIRTEPFANIEVQKQLGLDDPSELLGLYHGISLTQKSVLDIRRISDEVILYRDPIISYAHQRNLKLADVVKHVLVHEIGHHFGFSDADMERIENEQALD